MNKLSKSGTHTIRRQNTGATLHHRQLVVYIQVREKITKVLSYKETCSTVTSARVKKRKREIERGALKRTEHYCSDRNNLRHSYISPQSFPIRARLMLSKRRSSSAKTVRTAKHHSAETGNGTQAPFQVFLGTKRQYMQ